MLLNNFFHLYHSTLYPNKKKKVFKNINFKYNIRFGIFVQFQTLYRIKIGYKYLFLFNLFVYNRKKTIMIFNLPCYQISRIKKISRIQFESVLRLLNFDLVKNQTISHTYCQHCKKLSINFRKIEVEEELIKMSKSVILSNCNGQIVNHAIVKFYFQREKYMFLP